MQSNFEKTIRKALKQEGWKLIGTDIHATTGNLVIWYMKDNERRGVMLV
jgi:hypothetical protein